MRVVPTSAPRMIPRACFISRRPARAKPTSMMVVALLLCIRAVTAAPAPTAARGFSPSVARMWRSRWPATLCIASLAMFRPYSRSPIAPTTLRSAMFGLIRAYHTRSDRWLRSGPSELRDLVPLLS